MAVMIDIPRIQRIFVYDDSPTEVSLRTTMLRMGGFETVNFEPSGNIDEFARRVADSADGALCDHVLRNSAPYLGAELVARLYTMQFPAILMTSYLQEHCDNTIRKHRQRIPVVLEKQECAPEIIQQSLNICWNELHSRVLPSRRPIRTLIQILQLEHDGEEEIAVAKIPSWDARQSIKFPFNLIPTDIRSQLALPSYCIGWVNTGAVRAEDLFLKDFEIAPAPIPEDRLV